MIHAMAGSLSGHSLPNHCLGSLDQVHVDASLQIIAGPSEAFAFVQGGFRQRNGRVVKSCPRLVTEEL
jgi:hypothetical protein